MGIKVLEEIFFHKSFLDNGDIIDIKIEKVERKKSYEEGIRYSLVYVRNGTNLVRFDNHNGEGHHKHINSKKVPYEFIDEWALIGDFQNELKKLNIRL